MNPSGFLSDTLGLTKIPKHLPTIFLSFAGFTFVHLVFAPWLCNRWYPASYGTQSKRTKNNWAIHVVSQVHALVIVSLASYAIWTETPDRALDKAYGWSDTTGFVHGIAAGYFLWDTVDAVVNFVEFGFVVHGVVCLLVYAMSFRPYMAYLGTRFLLWEISTVFLNIHWVLDKTNRTGSTFQLVNGITLLLAFFMFRLVYGTAISIQSAFVVLDTWGHVPIFYTIVYGGGNIVLQGLNVHWFTKMIAALRRRFEPKQDERARLLGTNGAGANAVE